MLHEVYAPCTVADLAWSRQKAVALSNLIQQARKPPTTTAAVVPPRVTLLYGPPGCGKLESLKVLLREDVPPAASSAAATKPAASSQRATSSTPASTPPAPHAEPHPTVYHVFHTCEATVHAYAQYLQGVLTVCRGQASGAELPLLPPRGAAGQPGVASSSAPRDGVQRGPSSGLASSPPPNAVLHHAHIVKCYGESASHALHHCTHLFLREYEDLRAAAQREAQQLQVQHIWSSPPAPSSPVRPARLMDHLRRNLVFFVHTTHDTHNDKLDLNTSFPVAFLQSPALEQFHCTAITEINLRKRLRTIVGLEAQHRAQPQQRATQGTRQPPTPTAILLTSSPLPPLTSSKDRKSRRGAARKALAPSTPPSPACDDLIDADTLNAIAAGSQGDIRQALLQVQWTCLCPPPSRSITATSSASQSGGHASTDEAAASVWPRLEARRAALRRDGGFGGTDAAARQLCDGADTGIGGVGAAAADTAESRATHSALHGDSKGDADDSGSIDTAEVMVISSSSSSLSTSSSTATSPLKGRADQTQPSVHTKGRGVPLESRKRPRPATVADALSSSPPVTDLLALTDWQVDAVADRSAPPSGSSGHRGRAARPRSPSPAASPTSSSAPSQPQQPPQRSVLPTTRDEYLGLSHAVGRLLTQKYSLDEVLDILNVPPRKVLDYLANNQVRYFADEQVASCAACTDAASHADALRASEMSASYAGAPSAAALRERRQLADRTTAGESMGSSGRLLDVVALHAFYAAYCANHREVCPPPGFVAQEPPPFLRSAYPRLRDAGAEGMMDGRWRRQRAADGADWMARGAASNGDVVTVPLSELEWVQQAMARLDSAAHGPGAASRGGQRRRRMSSTSGGAAAAAEERNPDQVTQRIQAEEVDIVREGLPDALQRCGSTDAALLDYYALAPYIVLGVDPPTAPAHLPLSTLSQAPPPTPAVASFGRVPASLVFSTAMRPGSAAGQPPTHGARTSPSPSSADTGAATAAPRRTVFRFASTTSAVRVEPTPPPPPPQRRVCTPLQLAILQRGCSPAKAQLRDAMFVLGSDGTGVGPEGLVVGAAVDPFTAHVDEIEEFEDG